MPESKAIPKMIGLEQEYGCYLIGSQQNRTAGSNFFKQFRPEWLSVLSASGSLWDPQERMRYEDGNHRFFSDVRWRESNYLFPNGARFYLDSEHPEYCIPICRTAREALAHDKAGEIFMDEISQRIEAESGLRFRLIKNNTAAGDRNFVDFDSEWMGGVSFSTHENYLVRRDVLIDDLIARTIPFLIFRTPIIGAGKVGGQSYLPWVDYQISQRADFFKKTTAQGTMGNFRAIYNLRDCPYADPERFRRLHVIPGDANMCEVSGFLKLVTMRILLMMIEDGALDDRFTPFRDCPTLHAVSRDLTLSERYLLKNVKKSVRVLDILKQYAELFLKYLEDYAIRDPELQYGAELFSCIVDRLDAAPEECIGAVDWVTKRHIIREHLGAKGIDSWQRPEAYQLDAAYHYVRKDKSIFYRPSIQQKIKDAGYKLLSDAEVHEATIRPPATRSRFQVEVYKRLHVAQWNWRLMHVRDTAGRSHVLALDDPAKPWKEFEQLLADDPDEFLAKCKQAGMMLSGAEEARRAYLNSQVILGDELRLRRRMGRPLTPLSGDDTDDEDGTS
ncbi:MAG: hypothetical protein A2676_01210 [Candidatus Sungbacteria bacterium RIFCSPHIGHO2_01_FULL_51_22]|nr:MAG: hypothetical protein A2676_01210 [Candidatus Sungbacteria bacterium RIFCSPHIGHO2_01_FULL_51_22]